MADAGGLSSTAARLAATVADRLPAAPILVALSGGPDSAALAWAVARSGRAARTLSVDHGLPGSSELMRAAASIASALGLPHSIARVPDVGESETALRGARLAALEAARGDDEVIVTGHTLDDQAETVLGNVLRGSGTAGLGGIPRVRGPFVRPMLGVRRSEARTVAAEAGLRFVDDPQNEDATVRRNRLRLETIPRLVRDYNPKLVDALGRLGATAAADDATLKTRAGKVPVRLAEGVVRIPAASLAMLPSSVASRVARRALRAARGPEAGTADDVAAVVAAAAGARTTIASGIDVCREGPWVNLVLRESEPPSPVVIGIDDEVTFGDWVVCVSAPQPSVGRFSVSLPPARRLLVRTAMVGDRIAIVGGSKPVSEALAEAGVPARVRSRWPVVEADGRIAWIAGVRAEPRSDVPSTVTVRATRRNV